LNQFSSILVDEGLLPLLLHLIDVYLNASNDEVLKKCTEALTNLSINRKNRREIASCGICKTILFIYFFVFDITIFLLRSISADFTF
jgi:hypothetical protein